MGWVLWPPGDRWCRQRPPRAVEGGEQEGGGDPELTEVVVRLSLRVEVGDLGRGVGAEASHEAAGGQGRRGSPNPAAFEIETSPLNLHDVRQRPILCLQKGLINF